MALMAFRVAVRLNIMRITMVMQMRRINAPTPTPMPMYMAVLEGAVPGAGPPSSRRTMLWTVDVVVSADIMLAMAAIGFATSPTRFVRQRVQLEGK
jgi:hypothetical protein